VRYLHGPCAVPLFETRRRFSIRQTTTSPPQILTPVHRPDNNPCPPQTHRLTPTRYFSDDHAADSVLRTGRTLAVLQLSPATAELSGTSRAYKTPCSPGPIGTPLGYPRNLGSWLTDLRAGKHGGKRE
jgi:hypothetical protein